jgi:hypothetical protein
MIEAQGASRIGIHIKGYYCARKQVAVFTPKEIQVIRLLRSTVNEAIENKTIINKYIRYTTVHG